MDVIKNFDGSNYKGYARRSDCHDPELIMSLDNDPESINYQEKMLLCSSAVEEESFKYFAEKYVANERRSTRNYQTGKKMRYGTFIDVLLPKAGWDKKQMIRVAKSYAENVRTNKGTKWIAWSYKRNTAQFLRIWLCDREKFHVKRMKKPVYKKTQYVNKNTGAFCSRNDPDAVLKYKKGQERPASENEPIEYIEFSEEKTRSFDGGNQNLSETRKWLLETLMHSLQEFKIEVFQWMLMKRKTSKERYSRWVKRCICANNRVMRYIEEQINVWYQIAKDRSSLSFKDQDMIQGDPFIPQHEIDAMKIRTPFMNRLIELWTRYSEIFKHERFEVDGMEFVLAHKRCNEIEANCSYLRTIFDQDMQNTIAAFAPE